MKHIFKALALVFIASFAQVDTARAQGGVCESFDAGLSTWEPCTNANNVTLTNPPRPSSTGNFLHSRDLSGPSFVCSKPNNPLLGDLLQGQDCASFCYEVRLIDEGSPVSANGYSPAIVFYGASGNRVYLRPSVLISEDGQSNPGWHRVCASVRRLEQGEGMPHSADANWSQVFNSSNGMVVNQVAAFNALMSNVTRIELFADFTSAISEIIGYDNMCAGTEPCQDDFNATIAVDPLPEYCDPTDEMSVTGQFTIPQEINGGNAQVVIELYQGGTLVGTHPATVTGTTFSAEVPKSLFSTSGCVQVVAHLSYDTTLPDGIRPVDHAYSDFNDEAFEVCAEESCNPEPDPEPEAAMCVPFEQTEAICDELTGDIIVQLSNSLTGTFDPSDLGVQSLTTGVSVAQNPLNPLQLILSGANAGDTVMISTSAVQDGAGDGTGLDLCCMGEMEIIVPEELTCEAPVDVSVEKEWFEIQEYDDSIALEDLPPPHGFEVVVDLEAGTLNPGDVITVNDPASGQINVTPFGTPYGPSPWTCSISAGSWSCQYVVPQSGAILPATLYFPSIIDAESHVKNCASVDVANASGTSLDTNLGNNESCWEINTPQPDAPVLDIEKTGPAECPIDGPCEFTITLTNTGNSPFTGNVMLQDHSIVDGFNVTNVSPMPAGCGQNLPANPFACVTTLTNFGPGDTQTYTVTMTPSFPGGQVVVASGENCADVYYLPDGIPTGDYSWNHHTSEFAPAGWEDIVTGGQALDQSCAHFTLDEPDEDDTPVVSVEKTCSQMPSIGMSIVFNCQIVVSASGPVSGSITLDDIYSYPAFGGDAAAMMGQLTSNDPWVCASSPYSATNPAQCTISGADLTAAGGTSVLYVPVVTLQSDMNESDIQNCANVALDGVAADESCAVLSEAPDEDTTPPETDLSIVKACSPMPINGETSIPCQITVTGTGPVGGTIFIVDDYTNPNFNGDPNGQIGQLIGPNGWACDTAPYAGSWPTCSISSADFAAAGGTAVFTTSVTISPSEMGEGITNCAIVGLPDEELDQSCYDISENNPVSCIPSDEIAGDNIDNDCDGEVDEVSDTGGDQVEFPEFNITKNCTSFVPNPATGQLTATCTIGVTPQSPFTGTLELFDVATNQAGGGQGSFGTPGYDPNVWTCSNTGATEASCIADGATYPLDSNGAPVTTNFTVDVTVDDTTENVDDYIRWQNCVGGKNVIPGGPSPNTATHCKQMEYYAQCIASPEILDGNDNDCDGEIDEGFPEPNAMVPATPEVTLGKTSTGACTVNEAAQTYSCGFEISVQNDSGSPITSPLALDDSFGEPAPRSVDNVEGDGWRCTNSGGAGTSCLNTDLELAPGATSTLSMALTIPGLRAGGSFENCVKPGVSSDAGQQARTVQATLNAMGIDVGVVDGQIGPNTRRGIAQAQEQFGLEPTGEMSEGLFAALGLAAPLEAPPVCVVVDLPPMPEPPLICEAATAVKRSGECVCRFSNMYQRNASACGCIKGTEFVAGKGCIKKRQTRPNKPAPSSCEAGFRLRGGKCVLIQPKPKKATQCPAGYQAIGNACREIIGKKKRKEDLRGEGSGGGGSGGGGGGGGGEEGL